VHPEPFYDAWVICTLWTRQADALDDPGDIAQIEQVMGLCGRWEQVLGGFFVH